MNTPPLDDSDAPRQPLTDSAGSGRDTEPGPISSQASQPVDAANSHSGTPSAAKPPRSTRPKYERELSNFVSLTCDLALGRTEWKSRPYYIEYSTNSACNLRCIMCSQVEDPPVVSTPLELQEPFLEEIFQLATVLTPSATSEPLLNNLNRLLPLMEEHGVFMDVITNAVLLTPELTERLIPRMQRLTLSIDSHKKDVFEKLRAPAEFEQVVEHARFATRLCRENSIPVIFHMVLAIDCMDGLEDYVDFVAEMSGTQITVLELLHNSPNFSELDPFASMSDAQVAERLEAMRARAQLRGVSVLFEVHAPMGARYDYGFQSVRAHTGSALEMMHGELAIEHAGFCPMVMGYFKVEPDGTSYPCCRAPRELMLGNVFEQGVEGVWNGAPMRELRQRMFDRDYPECCKGCVVLDAPRYQSEAREREAKQLESESKPSTSE